MDSNDNFFQVKRGRPKKISLEEQINRERSLNAFGVPDPNSIKDDQKSYLKYVFSQQLQLMISLIPEYVEFPNNIKVLPLFNLLEEASKKVMVSEIELTSASLVLSQVNWEKTKIPVEEIIDCSFFHAKRLLESDKSILDRIQYCLISCYPYFLEHLATITQAVEIDVKSISKRYKQLTRSGHIYNVNYNYYVDEIIRVSPPYNINLKPPKNKNEASILESTRKLTEKNEYYLEPSSGLEEIATRVITYDNLLPLHDYEDYLLTGGDDAIHLASPYYGSEISENCVLQEEEDILKLLDF